MIPCHTPSFLMSSLFLLHGRFLWTALCPQCSRLELNVSNGQQVLVCLSLLGCWTLTKSLRAGRSVRQWINLDTDTPDHKKPISRSISSVSMQRRSLQLLSRLPRFRSFPGFSTVWSFNSNHVAVDTSFQKLRNFNDCLRTESRFRRGRVLRSSCHLIHKHCFRFSERQPEVRWLSEDSRLLPALVDQHIVSQKP